jgi:hypothetical protein
MNKEKFKRVFAKEILILFSCVVCVILFGIFLALRNSYFYDNVKKYEKEIVETQNLLDSLPTTKALYELYQKIPFFVRYKVDDSKYILNKGDENFFLQNYPKAQKQTLSNNGYFNTKFYYKYVYKGNRNNSLGFSVGESLARVMNEINKFQLMQVVEKDNKSLLFEYVDFHYFLNNLISKEEYRNKLYESGNVETTRAKFDMIVNEALSVKGSVWIKYQSLKQQKTLIENSKIYSQQKILVTSEILSRIKITALIILLIAYPLRLIIYSTIWAIKTLRS